MSLLYKPRLLNFHLFYLKMLGTMSFIIMNDSRAFVGLVALSIVALSIKATKVIAIE